MKKILSLFFCLIFLVSCSNAPTSHAPSSGSATVSVYGPEDEVMFSADVEMYEGMTALDILLDAAKEKNIAVVYSGNKSDAYITGIGDISEKKSGGWIYTVNRESIMKPAGKCILNPGDNVEWKYIEF